jgi:predicted Zn-dependent protease
MLAALGQAAKLHLPATASSAMLARAMMQALRRDNRRSIPRAFRPAAASLALLLSACGGNHGPAISKADREVAAKEHPRVLAQFGGAYTGKESAYLTRVGNKVAKAAGLGGDCRFTVVNTDVVNAFAVPGCYIYVTRGLMGIANSEGELASVLGHELGHIHANHSLEQKRRSLLGQLSVLAVEVITGSPKMASIAGAAAGFSNLRYSRDDEYEADDLGIEYLRKAGYDPRAAANMLEMLQRYQAFQNGARGDEAAAKTIPEWALNHPLTENRIVRAREAVEDKDARSPAPPERQATYLHEVDGLLYGDDPEQGFVLGRRFAHPDMRVAFEAPEGFTLTNSPRAVLIQGPDGLRGQFGGTMIPNRDVKAYAEALVRNLLHEQVSRFVSAHPFTANGVSGFVVQAVVATGKGSVPISVATYAGDNGQGYHFIIVSKANAEPPQTIARLFSSLRLLSPQEAARLRPRYIHVVRAQPGDTQQSLAARVDADRPLETLRMLNGLSANDRLQPGEPLKLVEYAKR